MIHCGSNNKKIQLKLTTSSFPALYIHQPEACFNNDCKFYADPSCSLHVMLLMRPNQCNFYFPFLANLHNALWHLQSGRTHLHRLTFELTLLTWWECDYQPVFWQLKELGHQGWCSRVHKETTLNSLSLNSDIQLWNCGRGRCGGTRLTRLTDLGWKVKFFEKPSNKPLYLSNYRPTRESHFLPQVNNFQIQKCQSTGKKWTCRLTSCSHPPHPHLQPPVYRAAFVSWLHKSSCDIDVSI